MLILIAYCREVYTVPMRQHDAGKSRLTERSIIQNRSVTLYPYTYHNRSLTAGRRPSLRLHYEDPTLAARIFPKKFVGIYILPLAFRPSSSLDPLPLLCYTPVAP